MPVIRGGTQLAQFGLDLQPGGKASSCPSISIALSEPGDSIYQWEMTVWVRLPESNSRVGRFRTIPPMPGGRAPNRVVAMAYAPGAVGWLVQAKAITTLNGPPVSKAKAEAWISRSDCCGSLTLPGVMPVEVEGVGEPIFTVETGQVRLFSAGATLILKADPFRRRASIINRINGGNLGDVAIGTSLATTTLTTGRLLKNGDNFETPWRGAIYGIGSAAGPEPHDGVSYWTEIG